ncbi:zinc ribbon domain-containing protein [Candidatus Parcubacteria bacterium]|nr:MAG: zinc ribbon domain-containing protein [Candidatus Parcubacteria bacterium]
MPIYSYHCQDCQNDFEIKATVAENQAKKGDKFSCPQCGSRNIKQNFGAVGYIKSSSSSSSSACSSGGGCPTGSCPFNP